MGFQGDEVFSRAMLHLREWTQRGKTRHDWLESYHTFSFNQYYDPDFTGFSHLRVINEDWVQPGKGFSPHHHRDMEIITYVLEGVLQHQDSIGNASLVSPDDVQCMTAGTGILHSEFNPSDREPVHFLQIWITPQQKGLPPGYGQRKFPWQKKQGRWCLVVSNQREHDALLIHQDAKLHAALLAPGDTIGYDIDEGRVAWLQVARGKVTVGLNQLSAGDGAGIENERHLSVTAHEPSELLLFDLPNLNPA